jgi:Ser/Thr protein kinase RdoA (MazF antagonist)
VVEKNSETSFYQLDPELVLRATEEAGFLPTGEFTQLNSYENRVFNIRLEKGSDFERVIAKFYRPGRWSKLALLEEHEFLFDLKKEGIPVVAPLLQKNSTTLSEISGLFVTFFPQFAGRIPEEFLDQDLHQVGRRLAQIHNVGSRKKFKHRAVIGENPHSNWENLELLSKWVVPELWSRYEAAAITIIEAFEDQISPQKFIRIHGDCHRGNLLAKPLPGGGTEFSFVDFDDSAMGPEVQDFWMLFSNRESLTELTEEQEMIVSGYEELREFPAHQWQWIPILRGLRIFNYSAWIARRWQDPSFPRLFPLFESFNFWAEEAEALERIAFQLRA